MAIWWWVAANKGEIMADELLQHTHLDGIEDYTIALDTLCGLAQRNLYLFEKDFEGLGFNSEARYAMLHRFLLASPAHRLYMLVHEPSYLARFCPRMMLLLRQFSNNMFIHQLPKNLAHLTAPFSVADEAHCLRRFHFDDPRGIFEQYDSPNARLYKGRFLEMWAASHPAVSASKLGL
jgi:hypothetical protein